LLEIKLINSDARRGCSSNTHNQRASVLFLALLLVREKKNTLDLMLILVLYIHFMANIEVKLRVARRLATSKEINVTRNFIDPTRKY